MWRRRHDWTGGQGFKQGSKAQDPRIKTTGHDRSLFPHHAHCQQDGIKSTLHRHFSLSLSETRKTEQKNKEKGRHRIKYDFPAGKLQEKNGWAEILRSSSSSLNAVFFFFICLTLYRIISDHITPHAMPCHAMQCNDLSRFRKPCVSRQCIPRNLGVRLPALRFACPTHACIHLSKSIRIMTLLQMSVSRRGTDYPERPKRKKGKRKREKPIPKRKEWKGRSFKTKQNGKGWN